MLRAEAEKDDTAFSQTDFGQRDLAPQLVFAEQPARAQHVLLRVAGDDPHVRAVSSRKRRAVDEVSGYRRREGRREWMLGVDVERQDRPRTVKLGRPHALEDVRQRQLELLYRQLARSVKTDQH